MSSVFLCHASQDKEFVERLALDLRANDINVWFDKWEIKVGDSIVAKINEGIQSYDYLAVVLTPHSIKSKWVQLELNAAFVKELEGQAVVVLPILAKHCEVPTLLAQKKYADFTSEYYSGLVDLLGVLLPEEYGSLRSHNIEIVDCHCHLWYSGFDADRSEVISRAKVLGVRTMITAGCSGVLSWARCINIAQQYERVYASIGLYPMTSRTDVDVDSFKKLAGHPKVVSLGEACLNYDYTCRSRELQLDILNLHFEMASKYHLPIVIRVAYNAETDFWELLSRQTYESLKLVFHCPPSIDFATRCRDLGYYLLVSGEVTYSRSEELRSIIKGFPIDRIFLGSDCPFRSPRPINNLKRNEPRNLAYVLDAMEKVLPYTFQDIARITTCTAADLFRFDECDKRIVSSITEPFLG